jgi:hypothetical protein
VMLIDCESWGMNPSNHKTTFAYNLYQSEETNEEMILHEVFQMRIGDVTQNMYFYGSVQISNQTMTYLNNTSPMYFEMPPFENAFEIDHKEEYLYFLSDLSSNLVLFKFSIKDNSISKSVRHRYLEPKASSQILMSQDGQSIFFTAEAKDTLKTGALCQRTTFTSCSLFYGYRCPLSTISLSLTQFISTSSPITNPNHFMLFKTSFNGGVGWSARMIDNNRYDKMDLLRSAWEVVEDSVFKLDQVNLAFYFYAVDVETGELKEYAKGYDLKMKTDFVKNRPFMKEVEGILYIGIQYGANLDLIVYDIGAKEFFTFYYHSNDNLSIVGIYKNMIITYSKVNVDHHIKLIPINSVNSDTNFSLLLEKFGKNKTLNNETKIDKKCVEATNTKPISPISYAPLHSKILVYDISYISFNLEPCHIDLNLSDFTLDHTNWNLTWGYSYQPSVKSFSEDKRFVFSVYEVNDTSHQIEIGNYAFPKSLDSSIFLFNADIRNDTYSKPIIVRNRPMINAWRIVSWFDFDDEVHWIICVTGYMVGFGGRKWGNAYVLLNADWDFAFWVSIAAVYFVVLCLRLAGVIPELILRKFNDFFYNLWILNLANAIQMFKSNQPNQGITFVLVWLWFLTPYLTLLFLPFAVFLSYSFLIVISLLPYKAFLAVFGCYVFLASVALIPNHWVEDIYKLYSYTYFAKIHVIFLWFFTFFVAQGVKFDLICILLTVVVLLSIWYCIIYVKMTYQIIRDISYLAVYGEKTRFLKGTFFGEQLISNASALLYYPLDIMKLMLIIILYKPVMFPLKDSPLLLAGSFCLLEMFWIAYIYWIKPFSNHVINIFEIVNHLILLLIGILSITYFLTENILILEISLILSVPYAYIIFLIVLAAKKIKKCFTSDNDRERSRRLNQYKRFASEIHISKNNINRSETLTQALSSDEV